MTQIYLCYAGAVDDSAVQRPSPAANMWQAGPPLLRRNSEDGTTAAASTHSPAVADDFRRGLPPARQSSDGAATSAAYDAWRRGSPQPVAAVPSADRQNLTDGGTARALPAVGRGMAGGDDAARAALAAELFGAGSGGLPAAGHFASFRQHHPPAPLQLDDDLQQQHSDPWSNERYGYGSGPSSGSTPGLMSSEDGYGCGGHLGADSFMGGSTSTGHRPCPSLQRFGFCRDGPACSFSHVWDSAQHFGQSALLHMGQPMLAQQPQQPISSFMSPSPTSSLLSLDSPARPYGSASPSPQPAPMLVSQDSVGFAFGAPGSAAFSASAGPRLGHASPSPQQQSLARAAFANAVAAQQYGGNGGAGAASDQRVHDPRLVRAALDPGNTFVGGAQSMFDGGAIGHDSLLPQNLA